MNVHHGACLNFIERLFAENPYNVLHPHTTTQISTHQTTTKPINHPQTHPKSPPSLTIRTIPHHQHKQKKDPSHKERVSTKRLVNNIISIKMHYSTPFEIMQKMMKATTTRIFTIQPPNTIPNKETPNTQHLNPSLPYTIWNPKATHRCTVHNPTIHNSTEITDAYPETRLSNILWNAIGNQNVDVYGYILFQLSINLNHIYIRRYNHLHGNVYKHVVNRTVSIYDASGEIHHNPSYTNASTPVLNLARTTFA